MPNGVVVGEVIIVMIQALMLWAKEKGLSDEECKVLMIESIKRIEATRPEDLPDA